MQALPSYLTPNSQKRKTDDFDLDGEGSSDEMEKTDEIDGNLAPWWAKK